LTRRPKRSLRCLLVEVPWQINEYLKLSGLFGLRVKLPTCYYLSNHSNVEAISLSALPVDTTKANFPDYNRPISLWLAYVFDCLVFLSVSIDYKQTNSIRDLIVLITVLFYFIFFIMRLDLTIGLECASLLGEKCCQLKSA